MVSGYQLELWRHNLLHEYYGRDGHSHERAWKDAIPFILSIIKLLGWQTEKEGGKSETSASIFIKVCGDRVPLYHGNLN